MLFYKHGTWLLFQIWTKVWHFSLRDHNKHSKCMKKVDQLLKFRTEPNSSMCISSPWYLIMVPNLKKVHPSIMDECVRINRWMDRQADRQTDWAHSCIPWFPNNCGAVNNKIISGSKLDFQKLNCTPKFRMHVRADVNVQKKTKSRVKVPWTKLLLLLCNYTVNVKGSVQMDQRQSYNAHIFHFPITYILLILLTFY